MPDPLPPDLSRLGDEIVAGAERAVRARRRRATWLTCAGGVVAALVVAAGVPGVVDPAQRTGQRLMSSVVGTSPELRPGCDYMRTATFAYPQPCRRAGAPLPVVHVGVQSDGELIPRRW